MDQDCGYLMRLTFCCFYNLFVFAIFVSAITMVSQIHFNTLTTIDRQTAAGIARAEEDRYCQEVFSDLSTGGSLNEGDECKLGFFAHHGANEIVSANL